MMGSVGLGGFLAAKTTGSDTDENRRQPSKREIKYLILFIWYIMFGSLLGESCMKKVRDFGKDFFTLYIHGYDMPGFFEPEQFF